MDLKNINDINKSIFLMLLSISGGYVAQTLGCQTQYLLTNNLFVKHIIIMMVIYFTNSVFVPLPHPDDAIKNTIIIYICNLLFTKMNIQFTLLSFS